MHTIPFTRSIADKNALLILLHALILQIQKSPSSVHRRANYPQKETLQNGPSSAAFRQTDVTFAQYSA
jgi:hypothetical protein